MSYESLTAGGESLNYRIRMRHIVRRSLTLGITVGYLAALTSSVPAGGVPEREALDTVFARYDREPDGPERDRLAARIDAIAHQKYATVSRLYWHIDLASAKAAAREQGRPILHLRMLGRLDEDLSCANSRLFRATLYANRDVSEFLRERFVLYWSSERPVPRVTIDYGDGRALERTITGNSAHYVLDEDGHVLDVLPGLYAPAAFRQELEPTLALAARVRHKSDLERARLLANHHQQHLVAANRDWDRLAGIPGISDLRQRLPPAPIESGVVAAQRVTVSKMAVELKGLRVIAKELVPDAPANGESEMWSLAGQMLYGTGGLTRLASSSVRDMPSADHSVESSQMPPPARVLDAASRALVVRLHNEGPRPLISTDQELGGMIARLEQTIVADTALNQLHLRPQISREIVRQGGRIAFATLNAWIYDEVFRTPRQDPWLGLLQRDVFTGLPGDGVVLRGEPAER